jgi:hypothetical protein
MRRLLGHYRPDAHDRQRERRSDAAAFHSDSLRMGVNVEK